MRTRDINDYIKKNNNNKGNKNKANSEEEEEYMDTAETERTIEHDDKKSSTMHSCNTKEQMDSRLQKKRKIICIDLGDDDTIIDTKRGDIEITAFRGKKNKSKKLVKNGTTTTTTNTLRDDMDNRQEDLSINPEKMCEPERDKNAYDEQDSVIYMDENNRLTDNAMDRFSLATLAGHMNLRRKMLFKIGYKPEIFHLVSKPLGWVRSHSVCKIVSEVERIAGSSNEEKVLACRNKIPRDVKKRLVRSMGLGNIETKQLYSLSHYDTVFFSLYDDDHWSVLVCYSQSQGLKNLFHYDSLVPHHAAYARRVKNALIACEILPLGARTYVHQKYPQQNSFYECGYSVLTLVCNVGMKYVQKDNAKDIGEGVEPLKAAEFARSTTQKINSISKSILRGLGNKRIAAYPDEAAMIKITKIMKQKSEKGDVGAPGSTNNVSNTIITNNNNNDENNNTRSGLFMCSKYHCMRQSMLPE